jgi:PAS domain S-box-containing protein
VSQPVLFKYAHTGRFVSELMIRILYVDDEEALLDVCKQFLELSGEMIVETTTTAEEGLQKMSTGNYDAVISDYQMPETNGIDFLKSIRSRDDPIPFILFTGRGREEVVIEALNSGADFYLQKGGDPSSQFKELEHKIKEAVRRNRAEKALKLNEARLNKAQAIGLTGCWELDLDGTTDLLWGSDESFRIFGLPRNAESTVDRALIEECIVEADMARRALMGLIERDAEYNLEYHVRPRDLGPVRIVRSIAELSRDPTGRPIKVVGVIQDITERRQAEARLRRLNNELLAIKECNKAMIRAKTELELVNDICQIVCDMTEFRMAWIGMAEHDQRKSVRPVGWSGRDQGYVAKANVTWSDEESGKGTMGTAIRTGRTVIMRDLQNNPTMKLWRESLIDLGYRSMIAIPLIDSGKAFGAFGVYMDDPEGFSQEEVDLLEEMTGDLAFGILGLRAKERQVRAEEALRESEERFRNIFDRAALGMVTVDMEGRAIDFNQRFLDMLGYSPGEIMGRRFTDITHPDDIAPNLELLDSIKKGEIDGYEMEKRLVRKDGTLIWIHLFVSKLVDPLGHIDRGLAIIEDITERKMLGESLRKSEEQYSKLVAAIPDFVIRTDMKGDIILINDVILEQSGYVAEELLGHSLFSFIAPEDLQKALKNAEMMVGGKLGPVEYNLIMKDGGRILFEANGDVLRDPNGMPTGMVFVVRNMTERYQLESKLREAYRRLRVMDGITRHDTVNKLMALEGYIDLMREGTEDPRDLDRLKRMRHIVGFLRDQVNATKEYQNLGVEIPEWQSVEEVCHRSASLLNLGDVSFTVDVGEMEILADPLLYKVFYNLMDNSVRHGVNVDHIWVNAERNGDEMRIVLRDNGTGISIEDKAHLFKEGYGKVHGLGLFLSREILDITEMTITETGEPGEGARFEILVPKNSVRIPNLPRADEPGE